MASEFTRPPATKVIVTLIFLLLLAALLLLFSGDVAWVEGWIFCTWFIVLCFVTIFYLYRKDPALLAERYTKPGAGNQKGWDRYVIYGLCIGFTLWFFIMPVDAHRYMWTAPFPVPVKVLGGIALLGSFFFMYRSYTDNTFLSPLVRMQTERKQQVITQGVYGFVRHPMYLGGILMFLGAPLLLGSLYGFMTGAALSILIAARITGEEKMLFEELEGYAGYTKNVKYRLVPFVW